MVRLITALEAIDPSLRQVKENNSLNNKKSYCDNLAGLSRNLLQDFEFSTASLASQAFDTEPQNPNSLPKVFETTCRKCHVDLMVGPAIPFQESAQ